MKLEFLLCGSPTDSFFSQMAFFRLCLDRLGGAYREARLVCVFGDHETQDIPRRWQPHFSNIEVRWAHVPGASNPDHLLQHEMRFELVDPAADLAILCDADVALLRPLDGLVAALKDRPAIAGVIAHAHFQWPGRGRGSEADWRLLAEAFLDAPLDRPYHYTLQPKTPGSMSPFYINMGVMIGTPAMFARYHEVARTIQPRVAELLGNWWAPQVSLPLICAAGNLPTLALPMRYNCPNDVRIDTLYPEEAENIVFLHYLRETHFKRSEVLNSPDAFDAFLSADFEGPDRAFQAIVREVTGGRFPFPA